MYFNFLGYFFSLYCVWKIFISTVNIVFDRVGKMDPITKTFDILVNWIGNKEMSGLQIFNFQQFQVSTLT